MRRPALGSHEVCKGEIPIPEASELADGQSHKFMLACGGREVECFVIRFQGELRAYQREGLGWLRFLERFGFGGCLADDMGLGKTVQVLAALAGRRAASPQPPPSLVIVPRSIVFNWLREAARFAPTLKVIDHTGVGRSRNLEELADADLIVTTYGTLRRDAAQLSAMAFDYVVLD